MADFIFNSAGEAQGFRVGNLLYTMNGTAIGQVYAERIYRLDGAYVGWLHRNMVVEKPGRRLPDRLPIRNPSAFATPPKCLFRSKALGVTYPDVFAHLSSGQGQPPFRDRRTNMRRLWEEEDDDFFRFSSSAKGEVG